MNLAQVADELYALTPTEFRAARDERAAQARASGDADLAGAIRKLRRPTVSAWLVNLLVREAAAQVGELLELGGALREAQQALDGDRLRELSAQRRQLVTAITQDVKRLAERAGQPVSAQTEREVRDTLEAALADPDVADAVRSGRLASALSYAGLGEGIELGDAVAVRPGERRMGTSQPHTRAAAAAGRDRRQAATGGRDTAERDRQRADAAERDRREAQAEAREAQAAFDEAEREAATARDHHEALLRRIEELERQLDQTHAESAQGLRALRQAQRSRDVAARTRDGALRRLARAEEKISRAGEGR
jgi:BMFP domain-containing protein YqiC